MPSSNGPLVALIPPVSTFFSLVPAVAAGAGAGVGAEVGFRSTVFSWARVAEGGICEDEGVGSVVAGEVLDAGSGAGGGGAALVGVREGNLRGGSTSA